MDRPRIRRVGVISRVAASLLLAAPAPATAAVRYALTDFGPGEAYAVNNLGQAAGFIDSDTSGSHSFVSAPGGGAAVDLGIPIGIRAINDAGHAAGSIGLNMGWWDGATAHVGPPGIAYAINDRDQVAGFVEAPRNGVPGFRYAALWDPISGAPPTLLASTWSQAYGINAAGRITGHVALEFGGDNHGFLTGPDGTGPMAIVPGLTVGAAVNNADQVAGWRVGGSYSPYDGARAVVSSPDGGVIDLGTLGGFRSAAFGINDAGQVVGYSDVPGPYHENPHAFLYDGGTILDLNDLIAPGSGLVLYEARGISDTGYIAATGLASNGREHAILLTPLAAVPEPPGAVLLASGAACLIGHAAWRRAGRRNENTPPG